MSEVLAAYLVRGDDASLVAQSLHGLLGELTAEDVTGLALEDLTAEEPDIGSVIDACLTRPFLVERRLVLLRELGRLPAADVDRLASYLASPSDTATLVLASSTAVPPRLVNAVKRVGRVLDVGTPSGRGRNQWLATRLKEAPVRLDAGAGAMLGEHVGEELGRVAGILDALAAAYGPGARIGRQEVEPFLGEAGSTVPWELTDAIDGGDVSTALAALHRLTRAGGRHPLVVLATLHRHYAAMARLDGAPTRSDAEAAALLGLKSAFAGAKARAQCARLGHANIRRAVGLLAAADLDLRGRSGLPGEAVLEVLVARLARLAPRRAVSSGRTRGR